MGQSIKKVTIIETGKLIEVYQSKIRGTWVDYSDCITEYKKKELVFK